MFFRSNSSFFFRRVARQISFIIISVIVFFFFFVLRSKFLGKEHKKKEDMFRRSFPISLIRVRGGHAISSKPAPSAAAGVAGNDSSQSPPQSNQQQQPNPTPVSPIDLNRAQKLVSQNAGLLMSAASLAGFKSNSAVYQGLNLMRKQASRELNSKQQVEEEKKSPRKMTRKVVTKTKKRRLTGKTVLLLIIIIALFIQTDGFSSRKSHH